MLDYEYLMELCLVEAMYAFEEEEVPVGALIVDKNGKIISTSHNLTRQKNSPTAHAEILAIEEASRILNNFRLTGCTLVCSKEPCTMCAGAINEARIKTVIFGCYDKKAGAFGSLIDINNIGLNHKVDVKGGILKTQSEEILKSFFKMRRGTEVVITGP
ncbi:MAG TPA: nucleoside deaminase, partial [Syntrophorhabdaceae bacterium]|nr:nucleoside deaminase [Syntrophorhabdaceae bacterium]